MNSDTLEFNIQKLNAQITILNDIKDTIEQLNKRYIEYIDERLVPNWTTDNGIVSIGRLRGFSERNIQDFITYLNLRISNLKDDVTKYLNQIEQA